MINGSVVGRCCKCGKAKSRVDVGVRSAVTCSVGMSETRPRGSLAGLGQDQKVSKSGRDGALRDRPARCTSIVYLYIQAKQETLPRGPSRYWSLGTRAGLDCVVSGVKAGAVFHSHSKKP